MFFKMRRRAKNENNEVNKMISYLADLLKVGNENAQNLKKQRVDEAKKEIEQELFESQITAHPKPRDGFGFPYTQTEMDNDGLCRFMNLERLKMYKQELKETRPNYDFTTTFLHTLGKTSAFFKRYGADKERMRSFIGDTIAEMETKYKTAIGNETAKIKEMKKVWGDHYTGDMVLQSQ